ncbi:CLOCK-interacting pacemaker [Phascolarctos cinereus]|uniref:CLOCK-interacting pacemaker n=1 Tax=Phascolarctos cinereus TaxID=38626 RepID=A0A6P5KAQ7_PHACI|nr:CLOCK-interacting pacemaker [Phascolarctos cinereus]XP_020841863.1 CLOCK-interacting pacemaker [Phascolarctos cinereus]XP_020841864.1 CLOCK-interacting pacemaker [Phascolarctos cinereus]XP_020841865.1 CLOCK-interacting pacemaker [Phascolarctos cinereus]XP_020841866.1 CLOCK-interacting pacemaker [Phascolarctos cinereus]XP_020841867.1 CLOCK-interacting pacemaker [Phascolarctos cinereus]
MERKDPPRSSPRRLLAKLGKVMERKQMAHRFSMAAAESDKDSGFSDGSSECLSSAEQMDSEDVLNTLGWHGEDGPRQNSTIASNSFPALSSMVVMKNVLVRQGRNSSHLQSWTVQPSFEVIPAQPQLVFLHPSVPPPVSPYPAGEKKNDSRNYLPILNSYTKIAPHPGKRSLALTPEDRGETGVQKRVCTERRRTSLSSTGLTKTNTFPSNPSAPGPPNTKRAQESVQQRLSSLVTSLQTVPGSPSVSSSRMAKTPNLTFASPASPLGSSDSTLHGLESPMPLSALSAPYGPPGAGDQVRQPLETFPEQQQSRHRRFRNTLVILHRSGLLEITLKTKELIRQNQATQAELDRLKEQTQLLMEATKGSAPQAWARLQESLTSVSSPTGSHFEALSAHANI